MILSGFFTAPKPLPEEMYDIPQTLSEFLA